MANTPSWCASASCPAFGNQARGGMEVPPAGPGMAAGEWLDRPQQVCRELAASGPAAHTCC